MKMSGHVSITIIHPWFDGLIFLKENMDAVDLENSVSTLSQYESKPF